MFVATDWYYISSQSGAGSGFAPGDPLIVFPVLGIAFLGISLPLLLQGAEKYKTCVKVAVALLISLSVVSATVIGVTLYAPTSGHGPWWPRVVQKEALTYDVLYCGLANQCNLENHQRWTHQRFSRSLLRQESKWAVVQQFSMVGTHVFARYDRNNQFSDRWEHVHIPIRLLVHCLRGNIKKQFDRLSSQSLGLVGT